MNNLKTLEDALGVVFKDKNLLKQALTHRSYINENPSFGPYHNERLEFLGDAVLELATTEYLYKNYPNPEGELTNWRAALVNYQSLAQVAEGLGLNPFLLLSRGESKDTGRAREVILANALEALIGAIYLDQGYDTAVHFIENKVSIGLADIIKNKLYKDAKSLFQEKAQEELGITPNYKVIEEYGPDHNKTFRVGVYLNGELAGEGAGLSKQEAEQEAARAALKNRGWRF